MNCTYIKSDGQPCRAKAIKGTIYCFSHNVDFADQKKAAVIKGGLSPKKTFLSHDEEIVLTNANDAKVFLSLVINEVWLGKIPATPVANTLGFLIRCFLDAYNVAEVETKVNELEKRLDNANI